MYKGLKASGFRDEWVEVLKQIESKELVLQDTSKSPFNRAIDRMFLIFRNSTLSDSAETAIAEMKEKYVKEEGEIRLKREKGNTPVIKNKTKKKKPSVKPKLNAGKKPRERMIGRRVKCPGSFFKSSNYDYFIGIFRGYGKGKSKKKFLRVAFSDGIWNLTREEIAPFLLPVGDTSDKVSVMKSASELVDDLAADTDSENEGEGTNECEDDDGDDGHCGDSGADEDLVK